jgi:hypothetical protein
MQFSGLFWWEGHGPEHEETQAPAVWASNGLCASTASIVLSSVLSIFFPLNSIGFLGSLDAHVRSETLFLRTCISLRGVCYFLKLSCVYRKPLRERRAIEGEKNTEPCTVNSHTPVFCVFSGTCSFLSKFGFIFF